MALQVLLLLLLGLRRLLVADSVLPFRVDPHCRPTPTLNTINWMASIVSGSGSSTKKGNLLAMHIKVILVLVGEGE